MAENTPNNTTPDTQDALEKVVAKIAGENKALKKTLAEKLKGSLGQIIGQKLKDRMTKVALLTVGMLAPIILPPPAPEKEVEVTTLKNK